MERLTVPDEEIDGGTRRAVIDARAVREEAMKIYWALKKYEDTGLSPEEINSLNTFDGSQGMKYLKLYQEEQQKHRWIQVSERLPEEAEYLGISDGQRYMKRIEVAYMTDTIEYIIGYFDGCKWMDKRHNKINNVIAWKVHEPFIS
ncbi:MAG: DUF551 domain-containing protein [Faecalicatena sp.]|uniref:DUF551 domain-containing protein n=1 Tax=Faecalicatena sp. TaxID=2005360 RepID=UPI00258B50C8|nr:DUF551 domain-containing protein [Faecalicatena sp.]MCI6468142.1 DUF551 domain-containing protein [Faecalicatena sp.]MDY5620396.1 DUF551 domain-containing protein [Lachnospiraceae bacterium]